MLGYWGYRSFTRPNSPALKRTVQKLVYNASDHLYQVQYSDLQIDLQQGIISLKNLRVVTDSAIRQQLLNTHQAPDNLIDLQVKAVHITGLKMEGGDAHIGRLQLDSPVITLANELQPLRDTSRHMPLLQSALQRLFKTVSIEKTRTVSMDTLQLTQGSMAYINNNDHHSRTTALSPFNVLMTGMEVSRTDTPYMKARHYELTLQNGLYKVMLDSLQMKDSLLTIAVLHFTPTISKRNFGQVKHRANARYSVTAKDIALRMDVEKFMTKQQLHVSHAEVGYVYADFYTSYNWPMRTPPLRRDIFPPDLIQQVAFDFTMDTLHLKKGDVFYRILPQRSGKEAVLELANLHGDFIHVTNNTEAKKASPYMRGRFYAKLMGAAPLTLEMTFNLADKRAPFKLVQKLESMPGKVLNRLVAPLSLMEVKSGYMDSLFSEITGDEYAATGHADLYYRGFKMRMLKKKGDKLEQKGFLTFLANTTLPNDNPKRNGKFREGPINIVRDPRESFLGFIWRASLDGMSSAMTGFDQQKDTPHNFAIDVTKPFAGPKNGTEYKAVNTDNERGAKPRTDHKK